MGTRSIIVDDVQNPVDWYSMKEPAISRVHPEPSEMFLDAIRAGRGSLVVECEFCGRTYFGDGGNYDEGEREHLEAMAKLEPDKYVEVTDFTTVYTFNGMDYAEGCPCNGPGQFEQFIWSNRMAIAKYLKTRAKSNLARAKNEIKMLTDLRER